VPLPIIDPVLQSADASPVALRRQPGRNFKINVQLGACTEERFYVSGLSGVLRNEKYERGVQS
jgi:hypothetical protein